MVVKPSFLVSAPSDDADDDQINPFLNRTSGRGQSVGEICKRGIVALTLFPFRCLLITGVLLVGYTVAHLASLGVSQDRFHPLKGSPLRGWRAAILEVVFAGRHVLLWAFGFIGIKVKGRPASKEEAPIIVANHVSGLIEGMFLLRCATMAEAHYIMNPVLGPIMKCTAAIAVDRNDPDSRHNAKEAIVNRATMPGWPQTLVFPEGTCTNGNALVQFKLGAFTPGLPVQPVLFRYTSKTYDPSFTFPRSSGGYLLGMLLQLYNPMEVEYLPVYVPNESEKQSPVIYAAGVQKKMAEALGVPATKHAAEDVALCSAAQRLHLPLKTGLVQWQAVTENLTQMRYRDASQLLKTFSKMDKEGKGRLDFKAFSSAMKALVAQNRIEEESAGDKTPSNASDGERTNIEYSTEDLWHLFKLLDVSGDGYVDFREYLCGVAVLNGRGQDEEVASLKFAFECLSKGEAHFTKAQLTELICRAVPGLEQEHLEKYFTEADCDKNGLLSRDEFISFAIKHREDLGLQARNLLPGFPELAPTSKMGGSPSPTTR